MDQRPAGAASRDETASARRAATEALSVPVGGVIAEGSPSTRAREDVAAPRSIVLDPDSDEVRLLIKLGAAVSLLWPDLPKSLRDRLRDQAAHVVLPPSYGEPKHCGTHDELNVWLESCRLKHF